MTAFQSPRLHPTCETLMRFASGHLSDAMHLLVESHLAFCPACRQELQSYEAQAGLGLEDLPPEELDAGCLENLMHKIDENGPPVCIDVTLPLPDAGDERFPLALQDVIGKRGEKIHWHVTAAGRHGHVHGLATPLHFISVPAGADARHILEVERFNAHAVVMVLDGEATQYSRGDVVEVARFIKVPVQVTRETLYVVAGRSESDRPSWLDRIMAFLER